MECSTWVYASVRTAPTLTERGSPPKAQTNAQESTLDVQPSLQNVEEAGSRCSCPFLKSHASRIKRSASQSIHGTTFD